MGTLGDTLGDTLGVTYSQEYVDAVNAVVIPRNGKNSFKKMQNRYFLIMCTLIVVMIVCMFTLIFVNTSKTVNSFLWLGIASITFFMGYVWCHFEYVPKLKFHNLYKQTINLDTIKEQWLGHDIHDEDDNKPK